MASASSAGKLDFEFFANRGIRLTEPRMMFPAFDGIEAEAIKVEVFDNYNRGHMLFSLKYSAEKTLKGNI